MGHGETVPPEIAKTLVGWKKHFNAYTQTGRFNVRFLHFFNLQSFSLYLVVVVLLVVVGIAVAI